MDTLESLLHQFIRAGDSAAMDSLVRQTRPRLLAVARRIGAPQDAEDSVQGAYHSLLRRALQPLDAPVLPWLLTTVVRIAYRRKAVNARATTLADRLSHEPAGDDPAAAASAAERATLLRAEVAQLPKKYRDAIVLHHFEGLTTAEIAQLLDAPQATVKARLQRGRRLLRGRLHPRLGVAVFALPWWLADNALALTAGGIMTGKSVGIAVGIVALLSVGFLAKRAWDGPETGAERREETRNDVAVAGTPAQPDPARHEANEPDGPPVSKETPDSAPDSETATLRVRVVDERGRPLPFAFVVVRGADQVREADLQRDGRATIEKLARHVNWELSVVYLSYAPYRAPVDLNSSEERAVTLRRPPERELSVHVVDSAGQALPGYSAMATHDAGNASGIADDGGVATLRVRGDVWEVQAGRASGVFYAEASVRDVPATRSRVRLVVAQQAAIEGRVLLPDGKPYSNAMLRVERDGRLVQSATAGRDGTFVIYQPVDAAPVDIVFVGAQVDVNGAIQFQENVPYAGRLTAVPAQSEGQVLRTRAVKLSRSLVVQVQTEDREGVANARVVAMIDKAWLGRRDGRTDASGVLALRGLAARGFRLEVDPPAGSGLMRRDVFVPSDPERFTVTLLRSAPYAAGVRFRGVALHGAWVSAEIEGERGRPVVADASGRFRISLPANTGLTVVLHVQWTAEFGTRSWTHPLTDRSATEIELGER